mmetsp:Transcript_2740/g.10553  ORF Transcript_2740/g.10553 Transcript_2740/m.10553 type:complete len:304 (-) Transcript_2740:41-952(-)
MGRVVKSYSSPTKFVICPPASLINKAPPAVSQLFKSASKYAVTLPQATHASMMAALPNMRIVRTGKFASAVIPLSMTSVDASVGAYPVTTTASNAVLSSPTFMGEPFNLAPPPSVAVKHSSRNGSKITAACNSPLYATPIEIADNGMPCTKFVVPSMGSTIQSQFGPCRRTSLSASALASLPAATLSSPKNPCSGKASATRVSMMRCTSPSTSVSKSRAFTLVLITSAPTFRAMMIPPSFAAPTATSSTRASSVPSGACAAAMTRRPRCETDERDGRRVFISLRSRIAVGSHPSARANVAMVW